MLAIAAIAGALGTTTLTDAPRAQTAPAARGELQGAVDGEGFLVAQALGHARRVWAVDRDGAQRHLAEIMREGDMRIVGTTAGPTVGYQDGKRMRLSRIADDRDLGMWGTNVRGLCDGVASNDQRFAVGWLEGDGGVMIVHGPTSKRARDASAASAAEAVALEAEVTAQPSWCGVASAGDKVALAFRDRDQLRFVLCTAKRCGGLVASTPLPRTSLVLGMGCVRNACLIAHRDQRGTSSVTYVTESGSPKWTKPIVTDATSVSVVGVGANAFAVGFANRDGSHVLRFDRKGNATQPWRGSVGAGVPALAWSAGHLLVAHYTNETVTPISLRLPE